MSQVTIPREPTPALEAPAAPARQPLTGQEIINRFDFLEGVVNEHYYLKIVNVAEGIQAAALAAASQAPAATVEPVPVDPADALRWGANVAETLLRIGESIGFGRAQQILGEQWEAKHDCAPRGRMGVTVKDGRPAAPQAPAQATPAAPAVSKRDVTDGTRTLQEDCISAIRDYARSRPADGELWESWFEAAFDLCQSRVRQVFDEHAQAAAPDSESVLIDGVAYDVPAAVAGELLSLHLDLIAAIPAADVPKAMPTDAELQALSRECAKMSGGMGMHYLNYGREILTRWGSASAAAAPVVLPEPMRETLEEAVSVLSSINQGKKHAVKVGNEVCYWQRKEWIDWAEKEVLPKVRALLTQAAAPAAHSDDVAVDRFADEMKAKLAAARAQGRGGWETCPPEVLSSMLREHVEKGDPRDVANFCMFLWCLGQPIAAAPAEPVVVKGVAQFRKKPVTISAIQWDGKNLREVITFTDGPPDTRRAKASEAWDDYAALVACEGLKIHTLEGKMLANVGDWIIRGVKGEFYPCKPDIFAATYEVAAAPAAPAVDASDTARLEWLVKEDNCVVNEGVNGCWVCWIDERNPDGTEYQRGSFPTFRAAIDAARAAQAAAKGE